MIRKSSIVCISSGNLKELYSSVVCWIRKLNFEVIHLSSICVVCFVVGSSWLMKVFMFVRVFIVFRISLNSDSSKAKSSPFEVLAK